MGAPNPANCARLCEKAGMSQPIHPHLFRHQMLTYLTTKGLSDAQIQLISGHESNKSLEVYQHLSLESVDKAYQDAVQSVGTGQTAFTRMPLAAYSRAAVRVRPMTPCFDAI